MDRTLLKQRGMSAVFCGEAVVTAVYILNRSPTKALNARMPYEAWHAFGKATSTTRRARRPTAFLTHGQRVRTTCDVVFDKAVDVGSTPTYDNFTVEYVHFEGAGGVDNSLPPSMSTPAPSLYRPQCHALQPRPRLQRGLRYHHHSR
jgi:hypothetical protein